MAYTVTGMAILCNKRSGASFVLYILPDDHTPAHMHLSANVSSRTLARVIITKDCPTDISQLRFRRLGKKERQVEISSATKKQIVDWANARNETVPSMSNWQFAQATWTSNNNGHAVFLDFDEALAYT